MSILPNYSITTMPISHEKTHNYLLIQVFVISFGFHVFLKSVYDILNSYNFFWNKMILHANSKQ